MNMSVLRLVVNHNAPLRVFRLKHAVPRCSFAQLDTCDLQKLFDTHFKHWKYDETMDLVDLTGVFEADLNADFSYEDSPEKTKTFIKALVKSFGRMKIKELRLPVYEYYRDENRHDSDRGRGFPLFPIEINSLLSISSCIGFLSPSETYHHNRLCCQYILQARYDLLQQAGAGPAKEVYLYKEYCIGYQSDYRINKVIFDELRDGWKPVHHNIPAARLSAALSSPLAQPAMSSSLLNSSPSESLVTSLDSTTTSCAPPLGERQTHSGEYSYHVDVIVTITSVPKAAACKDIKNFLMKRDYQLVKAVQYKKHIHQCNVPTIWDEETKLDEYMKANSESNKCQCSIMIKCDLTAHNYDVKSGSTDDRVDHENEHEENVVDEDKKHEDNDRVDEDEHDSSDGTYSLLTPQYLSKHYDVADFEHMFKPRDYWNLNNFKYRGAKKVIAFIDTGIDETHPAFFTKENDPSTTRVRLAVNCIGDNGSYVQDEAGHGTMCAGIACGNKFTITKSHKSSILRQIFLQSSFPKSCNPHNDESPSQFSFGEGIAPECEIVVFKVGKLSSQFDHNAVNTALEFIKEKCNGEHTAEGYPKVDVVSLSLGQMNYSWKRERAVTDLVAAGFIVVCCASNFGHRYQQSICYPARLGHVLCIGSHNAHGKPSDYCPIGQEMDFLAPGDDVVGPWPLPTKYKKVSGTSYASAAVSGLVCLILECLEKLNKGEILKAIEKKVHKDGGQTSCNHWMIKEILRNMATNPGIHFSERGYGSLQPEKFFGNPEYFLRSTFGLKT